MKKIMENLKSWVIIWVWFLITIIIWWIAYTAWINMPQVNSWEPLKASSWNELLNNMELLRNSQTVPAWWVLAFNLKNCPSGWIPADGTNWTPDLRWEFIRWLDNGKWIDKNRVLGSWQEDSIESHNHGFNGWYLQFDMSNISSWTPLLRWWANSTTSNFGWTETRPRNIALLYCVKE
jgi:hypothetical protein